MILIIIFIYYKNIKYELTNFTNKYFTNDINIYLNNYKIINFNIKNSKLFIILHIGNFDIGFELLKKIDKIKFLKNSGIIININFDIDNQNILKNYIKNNFKNNCIINII